MENNISPYVTSAIPEFIRGNSPFFTEFISTYYKYVEGRTKAVGSIHNRAKDVDIDETLDEYISEFYATYGEYLPKDLAYDKRNFIKVLSLIYDSKGTEKALKLLFRLIFNENIEIIYPSVQMLRASDGKWESEKYITLDTQFGSIPDGVNELKFSFSNEYGDYSFESTKIIPIEGMYRVYFKSYTNINVVDSQLMFVYGSNVNIYVGKLVKSPSKLKILDGGNNWQIGQVIIIPGLGVDTIARVSSITQSGGISAIEILEYGIHEENQTIVSSPYKNKPYGSSVDISKILISTSPNVYSHTINISEYTDGISENILGISDVVDLDSYFLEEYTEAGYSGKTVIAQSFTQLESNVVNRDLGLTVQEWLDSRATLVYEFSNIASTRGYFSDESGQISNQFIRLQDNYYYQAFSYVVETFRDIREYKELLNITHPAGTKRFSNLVKLADCKFNFTAEKTVSNDIIYVPDSVVVTDVLNIKLSKGVEDSISLSDDITIHLHKNISETVQAVSADDTNVILNGYDTGSYFEETYSALDKQLQIG